VRVFPRLGSPWWRAGSRIVILRNARDETRPRSAWPAWGCPGAILTTTPWRWRTSSSAAGFTIGGWWPRPGWIAGSHVPHFEQLCQVRKAGAFVVSTFTKDEPARDGGCLDGCDEEAGGGGTQRGGGQRRQALTSQASIPWGSRAPDILHRSSWHAEFHGLGLRYPGELCRSGQRGHHRGVPSCSQDPTCASTT